MIRRVVALLAMSIPLVAQETFPHHNLTFDIGAANPTGEINSFMKSSPQIGFWYGYRLRRYFQADLGFNMWFGAARVSDFLPTGVGNLQVGDREYMIPFGGRGILPLKGGRLLLSGGGGGTWLRYGEHLSNPYAYYGYSVDCPICTARSGWGEYGLVNGSYFLDQGQNFRVGLTTQFIHAHTSGSALGNVPGTRTTDHWVNVTGEVGFSF